MTLVLAVAEQGGAWLAADLLIVLGVGALVAWLFQEVKLEAIPGYLIAGVLIGPGVLGLVSNPETIEQISGIAVILLMFGIGLHLDTDSIRRGVVHIVAIGVLSTALSVLVAWVALAPVLGAPAGLAIASAAAMSSTAVFVRVLQSRRESTTIHGRVGLGVAIVQDMAAVAGLALMPAIARWAGIAPEDRPGAHTWIDSLPRWLEVLTRACLGFGGVTVLVLVGRTVLPRALREVARIGSNELVLIVSGTIAFGAALVTSRLGFSAEMGAFIAGFLLAGTPFRYQVSGQLAPIRDVLMAVFFTGVGLHVDPSVIAGDWWVLLLGVAALMAFKCLFIAGSGWALGMTAPGALLTGVYLANAGEFTLVVAAQALNLGVLSEHAMGVLTAIVLISLVISPLLVKPAHGWAGRLARVPLARVVRSRVLHEAPATPSQEPAANGAFPTHAIIAGFGPVGRALADRFSVLGVPFTVVELNPRTVERQATLGRRIIYGDITNPEVLHSAGIAQADAVIITVPDDEMVLRAVQCVRRLAPRAFIAVRMTYLSGKVQALQLGADHVTVEEIATAAAMEREVLEAISKRDPRSEADQAQRA